MRPSRHDRRCLSRRPPPRPADWGPYREHRFSLEDRAVPRLCLVGMPIVGEALTSPFFEPHHIPAAITVKELLSTARQRRRGTMRRVAFMAAEGGEAQARAIYDKTLKEVAAGTMAGPFSEEVLEARHGRHFNVIPSFGLRQGEKEDGTPKYRRIDDHSPTPQPLACRRSPWRWSITCWLRFEGFVSEATATWSSPPRICKELTARCISVTAVYNPAIQQADLFEIYGQPFGAGHAVPNFCRVAEFLARLCTRPTLPSSTTSSTTSS